MKPGKVLSKIAGAVDTIIKSLSAAACVVIAILALVVVSHIVGRFLFKQPLLGIVELVEIMMVIIGFFAIGYTAIKRGHVHVDLVISRLSRRTQAVLLRIAFFLSTGVFAVITYQGIVNTIYYTQHLGQTTTVLSVPFAPLRFVMALGCLLLCLRLLVDVFHPLPPKEGRNGD